MFLQVFDINPGLVFSIRPLTQSRNCSSFWIAKILFYLRITDRDLLLYKLAVPSVVSSTRIGTKALMSYLVGYSISSRYRKASIAGTFPRHLSALEQ